MAKVSALNLFLAQIKSQKKMPDFALFATLAKPMVDMFESAGIHLTNRLDSLYKALTSCVEAEADSNWLTYQKRFEDSQFKDIVLDTLGLKEIEGVLTAQKLMRKKYLPSRSQSVFFQHQAERISINNEPWLTLESEEILAASKDGQTLCGVINYETGQVALLPYKAEHDTDCVAAGYGQVSHPFIEDHGDLTRRDHHHIVTEAGKLLPTLPIEVLPNDDVVHDFYPYAERANGHMQTAVLSGLMGRKIKHQSDFHTSPLLGFSIEVKDNGAGLRQYLFNSNSRLLNSYKVFGAHCTNGLLPESLATAISEGILKSAEQKAAKRIQDVSSFKDEMIRIHDREFSKLEPGATPEDVMVAKQSQHFVDTLSKATTRFDCFRFFMESGLTESDDHVACMEKWEADAFRDEVHVTPKTTLGQ